MKITVKDISKLPLILAQMRLSAGLSQRKLALLLNVKSTATISHYETGARKMSIATIANIAWLCGYKMRVSFIRHAEESQ